MNLRRWSPFLLAGLALNVACSTTNDSAAGDPPAVVVLISVDQLRADLVSRYDEFYTDGFRRLIDQSAYYEAVHDHGISETAPGHATLSTGVVPGRSGIVANDFLVRQGDEWVSTYNVADSTAPIIGHPDMEGMSPRNLLHTGLADWVLAADTSAKAVSISGKDRSAILMAAHARGAVYWYDTGLQRFITSTYYREQNDPWVERFNDEVLPGILDSVWVATAPAGAKALARPDTAAYERDGINTYFPHRYADEIQRREESFGSWVARTPYPDRAVLELAKIAIHENGIGADDVTDFVALGFSQTDRIGHPYGALSQEQLENLLHLDVVLGDLFRFLDEEIGEGRWTVALSADHGAHTMPEWQVANDPAARRLTSDDRRQMAEVARVAREAAAPGQEAVEQARALSELPFLVGAYTREEIASGTPRDSIVRLLRNSYHPDRMKSDLARNGVVSIGQANIYMSTSTTGSGHGTPNFDDRWVPLIFLGSGVDAGRHADLARTVDLAPTLATVAGVAIPDDLDGVALPVRN